MSGNSASTSSSSNPLRVSSPLDSVEPFQFLQRRATTSGGAGRDRLAGGGDDDILIGRSGDDVLIGRNGDDLLRGNGGRDLLKGGKGFDTLKGGGDKDRLVGGKDGDRLVGQRDDDVLVGQAGDDTLIGGGGNDRSKGGKGNDVLKGRGGEDTLQGGSGDDTIRGGAARDILIGGSGSDVLAGGRGDDVFVLARGQGEDLILDFESEIDSIGLSGNLSFEDLEFQSNGGNTAILVQQTGEVLATLVGVTSGLIEPIVVSDRIFVQEGASTSRLITNATTLLDNDIASATEQDAITFVKGSDFQTVVGELGTTRPKSTLSVNPVVIGPLHGSLVLNSDGTFTYRHNGSENSSDRFTYGVISSDGMTAAAEVLINIGAVNDAPEIITNRGASIAAGDTTIIDSGVLSATDPDNGTSDIRYTLTSQPTHGQLESIDAPGVAIASFTQAEVNTGKIVYVHDGSFTTSDQFRFRMSDGLVAGESGSFGIVIDPTGNLPILDLDADNSSGVGGGGTQVTFIENGGPVAIATDVTVTDSNSTELTSVTITLTTRPDGATESLAVNGVLSGGITASAYDPATGQLLLTGTASLANYGQAIAQIQYNNSSDDPTAGDRAVTITANDGTSLGNTVTSTVTVTPVNDAPALITNTGITVLENNFVTLTLAQLSATDLDDTAAELTYSIITPPAHGRIALASNPMVAIASFTQANINNGQVRYIHNGGENTADSFAFTLADGGEDGALPTAATVSVTVTPQNDSPQLTVNTGATVREGETVTLTTTALSSRDPDTANTALTYSVTTAPIRGQLQQVDNPGVAITTFTQDDLVNGRVIYVHNGSEAASDRFQFSLSDGGANGSMPVAGTFTLSITPVNDAPVLDNSGDLALPAVLQDTTAPTGNTVADLLASGGGTPITDADIGALVGIAVVGLDSSQGSWEFSTNGGETWTAFDLAVSDTNATLLNSGDRIRLIPAPGFAGDIATGVTFRAWDTTDGNPSGTTSVDVSVNGTTTAYSTATDTASIRVSPLNDAPTLEALDNTPIYVEAGAAVVLDDNATIADVELDALNSGLGNYSGASLTVERSTGANPEDVFSLSPIAGITVNGANVEVGGVAIATLTTTGGTLTLTFTDANGEIPTTAQVNAILQAIQYENSSDNPAATVDLTVTFNDGNTGDQGIGEALEDSGTLTVTLTASNDAPVLSSGSNLTLPVVAENASEPAGTTVANLLTSAGGNPITDVDNGTVEGIAVVGLDTTYGTWEFSLDNGASWTAFGTVSDTSATLLDSTAQIRLIPAANLNGTLLDGLTFRAWDTTDENPSGTSGVDVSVNGGTTAYSTTTETVQITVSPVNTAPGFVGLDNTPTFIEGETAVGLDPDATVVDVELDALNGGLGNYSGAVLTVERSGGGTTEDAYSFAAMGNVAVNGTNLEVSGVAIATFDSANNLLRISLTDANGTIPTTALVNEILQAIQYSNSSDNPNADVNFIFTLDDGNTGNQGSGGNLQGTASLTVTVTPTNDAPTLVATTAGDLSYTEGDGTVTISPDGLGISDSDDTQIESATVQITGNYQAGEDILAIATPPMGITASFDVTSGTLALTGSATLADYTTALQQITYENISGNPVDLPRTVTFTVNDGDVDSAPVGRDILISQINDAPALDNSGNLTLTAVLEDAVDPAGNTVAEILDSDGGNPITDPDTGAVEGIAIIAIDTSQGSWEFSLDDGATWATVGNVSATSALILGVGDRLRFIPAPDFTGESLDSITFRAWDTTDGSVAGTRVNPTPNGGTTAFSVDTETASITVNPLNDAPVLTGLDNSPTFTEKADPVILDADATISDVELDTLNGGAGNYSGAVLTLERVSGDSADDVYSFSPMGDIVVNGSSLEVGGAAIAILTTAGGGLTIRFTDANGTIPTTALVNTILQSVQYANTSDNPPAAVQLQVEIDDGNTGNQGSGAPLQAVETLIVSIAPVNDAPVLATAAADSLAYDENDPATAVSPAGLEISDPDSTEITSATVTVSSGYINGEDELVAIALLPDGITSSFDTASGVLTLTGTATLAQYTSALQTIGYRNASNSPGPLTRTVSFTVNDGDLNSNTVSRDLTIVNQNDAPTLDTSGNLVLTTVMEDATNPLGDTVAALLASAGGDPITDPDAGAEDGIAVTGLDTTHGIWEFSTTGGTNWTAFGVVSDTQATLLNADALIRFVPNANFNGDITDGIRFRAWDITDGNPSETTGVDVSANGDTTAYSSDAETASITVTAINDAPVFTNLGGAIAFTEDGPAVIVDGDVTLRDVDLDVLNDGAGNYSGASVTISRSGGANAEDSFTVGIGAGVTINGANLESGGVAIATITATGSSLTLTFTDANGEIPTTALVNAILQNIEYSNSSDTPPASVDLDVVFSDGNTGDQGSGTVLTDNGTITVTITPTNDAPVLTAAAPPATYNENDLATILSPTGLGITDADDTQIERATVHITGNYQADEDLLSVIGDLPDGITSTGFDITSGSITLTGSASLENYTAALQQIGYANSSESPNTGDRTLSFTVNDGNDDSNTVSQTLSITAANDAPILDASSNLMLANVNQDDTNPVGTSVADLLTSGSLADAITDPDAGAVEGIAVIAVDNSHGTWEYSIDSGTTWSAFGSISATSATLLTSTAQVRFVPDGSYLGSIPDGLTFHAWDTTDGNPSGTTGVNISPTGGTRPFSVATDTVSLDVTLETPPVLSDDSYTVEVDTTLTRVTGDADDLLDNDNPGTPATDIASFGGGDLGGDASSNAPGDSVALAGGTITVNADGSFSLLNPTIPGSYTFNYLLDNGIGSDIGSVTIEVQQAPTATNDTVAISSTPINDGIVAVTDDPYHTNINTLLTVADGANDLLANDTLGFQAASLTGFGNTVDMVTTYTPGATGTTAQGGTLIVNADGSFNYTPINNFVGLDSFFYQIENTVNGSPATSTAEVTLAVGDRPLAVDDIYSSIGNIGIDVDLTGGILANDSGSAITLVGFGDSLATADDTLTGNTLLTASGSTLLLNADGSFDYTPGVGVTGTETFFYTIQNNLGTEVGQIDIEIDDILWFIDNSAATSTNIGTFTNPFTSLANFNAVNDGAGNNPGDNATLYLSTGSGSYTDGLVLRDKQVLVGQGASGDFATLTGLTLPDYSKALPTLGGIAPTLINGSGNGITLGQDNSIYGVNIGNTSGAGMAGTGVGTLTVRDVNITGAGRILDLDSGSLDAEFGTLTTTTSNGGAAIAIQNSTDGTVTVTGNTNISGSETGVELLNNSGTAFVFNSLNVTSSDGSALTAIGGGRITNTEGAIAATNGAALNLDDVFANLSFTTLDSTDSTIQGLRLTELADGSSVDISGDINITNAGAEGIRLSSATGAAVALNLGATASAATTTVSNAANASVQIDQAGAGSDIDFGILFVQNRNDTGIQIENTDGFVSFKNIEDFNENGAGGYGLRIEDSAAEVYIETLTIDAAVTTIAETLLDGRPTNDGDGDGIFLKNNSGNFTLNQGSLFDTQGDGIDVRSVSGNLNIRATIGFMGGDGIQLVDISGANNLLDSVIVFDIGSDRAGVEWWGSGSSAATLTVDSGEFRGATGATNNTGIAIRTTDTYSARLEASDASIVNTNNFERLNGNGIDVIAAGASEVVTIIENANLRDAEGADGQNGIRYLLQDTASIRTVIDGADLENVMNGTGQAGAIAFLDDAASDGMLIANVRNSAITNSGQIGINADFVGSTDADLTFATNVIQTVELEALRAQFQGTSTGVLRLLNNQLGTPIAPAGTNSTGQEAVTLLTNTSAATTINVLMNSNLVSGSGATGNAMDISVGGSDTLNLTLTGNTFQDVNGTDSFTAATTSNTATLRMLLQNNAARNLAGAATDFELDNTAGGTFELEASGNTGTITQLGTITTPLSSPLPTVGDAPADP